MLNDKGTILEKINIFLIVQFCLDKYHFCATGHHYIYYNYERLQPKTVNWTIYNNQVR